ncbi:MAG TPA: TIGR03089 family protein [Euzebyales bacterium]
MDRSASAVTLARVVEERTRTLRDRPLLTVYDDRTGARTELSYATADNWAAKTAHLLAEDVDVRPGDTVLLDVDGHWTAAVLTLACWKLGAAVMPEIAGTPRTDATAVCCHTSRLDRHPRGPVVVVGDGLRAEPVEPLQPRDGLVVLGEDVHAYADEYDDQAVHPASPALVTTADRRDQADVLAGAGRWRGRLGESARVGLAAPLDSAAGIEVLAGVVLAGGSLVGARSDDAAPPWRRWVTERVTAAVVAPDALSDAPAGIDTVELDP